MLSLYVSLRKSNLHTDVCLILISTTFLYLFYFIRQSELNFSKRDYRLLVFCILASSLTDQLTRLNYHYKTAAN